MKLHIKRPPSVPIWQPAVVVLLVLTLALPGCVLVGAGAAAVGGCALLDENEDDRVTVSEASASLFDAWDANDDDALSSSEFDDGVNRSDAFDDWSGEFEAWDANENGTLSEAEFRSGVSEEGRTTWWDRQCDELGL